MDGKEPCRRQESSVVLAERLNLRVCGHALRWQRGAVHVHDLEL